MRTAAVVLKLCQYMHIQPETPHQWLRDIPDGGGGRVLLKLNILLELKVVGRLKARFALLPPIMAILETELGLVGFT